MPPAGFPRWVNWAAPSLGLVLGVAPAYVALLFWYGASPRTTDVGYRPSQPLPFSHAVHAGQLATDCRYCHDTVEQAAHAAVPPTETCLVCHRSAGGVFADSDQLEWVRRSAETGLPIPWVRVHDLPDYVFFDHRAHTSRSVGCVSCHGRVDEMEVVSVEQTLSMGWCLDCHRVPEPNLRPLAMVTSPSWVAPEAPAAFGAGVRDALGIAPSTECTACHR